jgi:hypothetical protein
MLTSAPADTMLTLEAACIAMALLFVEIDIPWSELMASNPLFPALTLMLEPVPSIASFPEISMLGV